MRKASPSPHSSKRRTPDGVLTRAPVALRLLPEELARLKTGAQGEMRTNAAFARLCFLHGLAAYERDPAALLAR